MTPNACCKYLNQELLVAYYIGKVFTDISCITLRASLIWRLAPNEESLFTVTDHQRIIFAMISQKNMLTLNFYFNITSFVIQTQILLRMFLQNTILIHA
jgi:hypothetical protein